MMFKAWNAVGRPAEIHEIVGQKDFTDDAKGWIENSSYPEALLFVGPSGIGKTSAARVIGMKMLGEHGYDTDFYECNASDDRGIDFVRVFLKQAATTAPYQGDRKVILLDEADGLTPAAQDAVRQIIENNTGNCLFIFTANEGSKIRPAIKSRCVVYQFKPINPDEGSKHLFNVCEKVGVPNSICVSWSKDFPRLIRSMNGDLRACVNMLEALSPYEDSLHKKIGDMGDISKAAISAMANDFLNMRVLFHDSIDRGRDKAFVMRSFYQNISSFFNFDSDDYTTSDDYDFSSGDEKVWSIMRVYGDMMRNIHEWPDSDYAFLDYFVSKLEGELKQ